MISFIVPAYNEEFVLEGTLRALRQSASECLGAETFEMIVVNDASTDRTAEIAERCGAHVVHVQKRQIAAVRNAGAKESRGDWLIFVDADTLVPPETLQAAIEALRSGAVGGGSQVAMDGQLSFSNRMFLKVFLLFWKPMKLAAGCFVFVRRTDFEEVGGFDERYFASEEIWLSKALKTRGRFVIVPEKVVTSGRKARMHSTWHMIRLSLVLLWKGPKAWQKRDGLDLWYDGRREVAEQEG